MVAGDPEKNHFRRRIVQGIPIDEKTFEDFLDISSGFRGVIKL
jgi:hypothetical protein